LLSERVSDWSVYPFNVPTIASLRELEIEKPVVFFVGENGSGKSTLLEAIAIQYGFGGEGGNRNFSSATTDSVRSVDPLARALRIAFSRRTGAGFFCERRASSTLRARLTRWERLVPTVAAAFTPSRTANLS
jgi:predicted ATPase